MRLEVYDAWTRVTDLELTERSWLKKILSARPKGYRYIPSFRAGIWDGFISLFDGSRFPTGLLNYVLDKASADLIDIELYDHRIPVPLEPYDVIGFELRDYQRTAVESALAAGHGVLKMATNAGKTLVIACLIQATGRRAVVIVPSKALLTQTADDLSQMLGMEIGRMGAGSHTIKDVTVTTLTSLPKLVPPAKSKTHPLLQNRTVICDECFPAGSLVDNKPIESLVVGDIITAWDEHSGRFVSSTVTQTYCNDAPNRLVQIYTSVGTIVCTENHPIYANDMWLEAHNVEVGMQIIMEGTYAAEMLRMRDRVRTIREKTVDLEDKWEKSNLLLRRVQAEKMFKSIICNNDSHKQEVQSSCKEFGAYEVEESYVEGRCERACSCIMPTQGLQVITRVQGRERETSACSTKNASRRTWLERGISSKYGSEQTINLSDMLQVRHCQSRVHDWHRSRWANTSWKNEVDRQEENSIPAIVRVDSVEILKRGSDGRFERLCPDGKVYNLEVEKFHTYTVNGFVVHNCQHSQSKTIMDNIVKIPGYFRYGLSGTPLHYDDLSDMKLMGATGQIIVDVTNTDLIKAGWSVKPTILFQIVECEHDDTLDYPEAYDQLIVENKRRNAKIASIAKLEQARGPVLVLIERLRHADLLAKLIPEAVKLTGKDEKDTVVQALEDMRQGKIRVVVATHIFGEGINVPSISTIILADAAKSHIRTLQRIGRGLRTGDGKTELRVYDFLDDTNDNLLQHSCERYDIYQAEGFKTKLLRDTKKGTRK